MPRKLFKRYTPSAEKITNNRFMRVLGKSIYKPSIWHFSRRAVTRAILLGTFIAFLPVPFQMLLAAFCAILFNVNLPISVAFVCVTNPLTIAPLFYLAYKIGLTLFSVFGIDITDNVVKSADEGSFSWLIDQLLSNWQPFLLGCIVTGLFLGLLLQFIADMIWRWSVISRWRNRIKKPPAEQS